MNSVIIPQNKRYLIKWVGRCQYDNHDKIWGWFYYFQQGYKNSSDMQNICYAFWARTGKSPSFKKHEYNRWTLNRMVSQKQEKKYELITIAELEKIWPSFYTDLENKFVFHLLSENI